MNYRNLVHLHRVQAERLAACIALRYKHHSVWHDLSWADYRERSLACAAALADAGVKPGDRVGLLAENSVDWLIADMGIMTAAAVNVPPHAPLTARQVQYQLHDAGAVWLFVSNAEQLAKVRAVRSELPQLRGVVVFDRAAASDDCIAWDGFLQRGRNSLSRHEQELRRREQALDDGSLATIMYTSGTTGDPKGVMLTHGNLLSNAVAVNEACPRLLDSVILSWLPFSHIYARTVDHYLALVGGVTLCLSESAETVVNDLAEIRPTHMSCVPRFYEKLLTAVADPDPEKTKARLRRVFGSRINWLSSGGAPLPSTVARAYQEAGLLVLQGYGLTESSPVISFNRPDSYKPDTVGQAIPGVEVKIADDGEILTRGPHVMAGYWNMPEATAETVRDGWLYTGDLGRLDEDGFLSITGRKKELLVLSNGKKVVPSYIEGLLLADSCIDQAVVFGEGKSYLTALIVPHWENLRQAGIERDEAFGDASAEVLAKNANVRALLEERIKKRLQDVSSAETVKKIAVLSSPLTVEGNEMTVSLKLRRPVIEQKYQRELQALYTT